MITALALRQVREAALEILSRLSEQALPTSYAFSCDMPSSPCQYWEYELSLWQADDTWHNFPCGCFTGPGRLRNADLGIDTFFSNNDRVLGEFSHSVESGAMNDLVPPLTRAEELVGREGGAALNVYSYLYSNDEWLRSVCEEYILIIHLDESNKSMLCVGCQQFERYRIKVPAKDGPLYISVPFDKVDRFKGHERVEGHRNEPYYEYQVALSFAGEDRRYVAQVARHLRQKKVRVFYDAYETVSLWGKDLYAHLDEVYRKRARYCVVFLSQHYGAKLWTNHERESAQARAFTENQEYLLPVKLEDTEIPGIRPTIGYVSRLTPKQLADLIYRKVHGFPV